MLVFPEKLIRFGFMRGYDAFDVETLREETAFGNQKRPGSGARDGGGACRHATAPRPFFATSVSSFNEAPRGRFSPRSHWLTRPVVTLR